MGLSNTRRVEKQLESAYFEVQHAAKEFIYEVDFKRWFKTMLEPALSNTHANACD